MTPTNNASFILSLLSFFTTSQVAITIGGMHAISTKLRTLKKGKNQYNESAIPTQEATFKFDFL